MSTHSSSVRAIILPKEHGSWSLAFEPVALGLLVATSRPGLFLAVAVIAGFFVRRPLKLAATIPADDCRRGPALLWAILFSGLALSCLGGAAIVGSWPALWPLLLGVPFGAIFLWFDLRNEMREAEAELSGSAAFALVPAAMATLAGWSAPATLGLAALMLTRSLPTVLTVRTYLRQAKGLRAHPVGALASAGGAFAIIAVLGLYAIVPVAGALLAAGLFLRTIIFVTPFRPAWPAKRVGLLEAAIGIIYLGGLAGAYHNHLPIGNHRNPVASFSLRQPSLTLIAISPRSPR